MGRSSHQLQNSGQPCVQTGPLMMMHTAPKKAAEIARKDMKDLNTEVKMYDRIAADYAGGKEAPKALLAAGQAFDKGRWSEVEVADDAAEDLLIPGGVETGLEVAAFPDAHPTV